MWWLLVVLFWGLMAWLGGEFWGVAAGLGAVAVAFSAWMWWGASEAPKGIRWLLTSVTLVGSGLSIGIVSLFANISSGPDRAMAFIFLGLGGTLAACALSFILFLILVVFASGRRDPIATETAQTAEWYRLK